MEWWIFGETPFSIWMRSCDWNATKCFDHDHDPSIYHILPTISGENGMTDSFNKKHITPFWEISVSSHGPTHHKGGHLAPEVACLAAHRVNLKRCLLRTTARDFNKSGSLVWTSAYSFHEKRHWSLSLPTNQHSKAELEVEIPDLEIEILDFGMNI